MTAVHPKSELRTVQVWGVLTKAGTVGLGILQTAVVLRLLGPEAYGIVGIVISLGALVGVSQHVGAVDAAIREIAVADTARRRAAVFWVSLWFRLVVTVPISLILYVLAPWIGSHVYALPDIPHLVRLMSVVLVLHGVQGILGGAFTGQRAFGTLYLLQLVMSMLNVPLFGGLTFVHGVRGFFEAVILAAFGFSLLLACFLRRALGGTIAHPGVLEARAVLRDIIHTGGWTYGARILSVAWQRFPVLLLGRWASPDVIGLFSAAVTFGSKLQLLAAALGEVNLAFLSSAFATSRDAFRRLAVRTLEDVGAVTLIGSLFLILFADVLVPFLAGAAYVGAVPLMVAVTWAYAAFAFLDIATNTVFVSSRHAHLRAASFAVLAGVSVIAMIFLRTTPLRAASVGVLLGGIAGLLAAVVLTRRRMALPLFPGTLAAPLVLSAVLSALPIRSLSVRALLFFVLAGWTFSIAFPSMVARLRGQPVMRSA